MLDLLVTCNLPRAKLCGDKISGKEDFDARREDYTLGEQFSSTSCGKQERVETITHLREELVLNRNAD